MKRLTILTLSIFTLILLTACEAPKEETISNEEKTTPEIVETKPKQVETFTIGSEPEIPTLRQPASKKIGSVNSAQKITVKAETGGKIAGFAINDGEAIAENATLATLGSSLQADINEINYLNALTTLKNAEEQLTAKHQANQKNVENAQIAIQQAEIQFQNALQAKDNINRTSQLGVNNLREQGYSSFSNITEHLRDVVSTARSTLRQAPIDNDYGGTRIEDRINRLDDGINQMFYSRGNVTEIRPLINEAEVILSELKTYLDEFSYQPNYAYNSRSTDRYYNSAPEFNYSYNGNYNRDSGSYQVIYNAGSYYPGGNGYTTYSPTSSTSAPYYSNDTNNPLTEEEQAAQTQRSTTLATLAANVNKLLPVIQGDQASLLQVNQGISTTRDSQITQNTNADAQIELAQTQLKNAQQLFEIRIDQVKLEEQGLADQIDQLRGQLALSGRNRDTRNITSPIAGTLIKTFVEPGEMISPGQAIAEIGNLDALEVKIAVTQTEAAKLQEYQPVIITTAQQEELPGFISKLPNSFDPQTKTGEIEIVFDHRASTTPIKPGAIVSVTFQPPRKDNDITKSGIWIPLKSIYFQKDNFVYINDNGQAKKQIVTSGKIEGTLVEIKSGLKKDDQVILTRYGIQEGDKIEN